MLLKKQPQILVWLLWWQILSAPFWRVSAVKVATTDLTSQDCENYADFSDVNQIRSPGHPIGGPTGLTLTTSSRASQVANSSIDSSSRNDLTNSGHRMEDFTLAQQVGIFNKNNDENESTFAALLQLEKERQQKNTPQGSQQVSPVFVSVMASAGLVAVSSWIWDPASASHLWKSSVSKKWSAALAVAWLPWVWAHPAQLALLDLFMIVQVLRQPTILPFFQKEVVPRVWKTAKAMIISEIWSRSWKWFFANIEEVKQSIMNEMKNFQQLASSETSTAVTTTGSDDKVGSNALVDKTQKKDSKVRFRIVVEWQENSAPSWLVQIHSVVIGGIRKGLKSNFKKSVQEAIMSSISVWKHTFQSSLEDYLTVSLRIWLQELWQYAPKTLKAT